MHVTWRHSSDGAHLLLWLEGRVDDACRSISSRCFGRRSLNGSLVWDDQNEQSAASSSLLFVDAAISVETEAAKRAGGRPVTLSLH